jgi:hypothetical protein
MPICGRSARQAVIIQLAESTSALDCASAAPQPRNNKIAARQKLANMASVSAGDDMDKAEAALREFEDAMTAVAKVPHFDAAIIERLYQARNALDGLGLKGTPEYNQAVLRAWSA